MMNRKDFISMAAVATTGLLWAGTTKGTNKEENTANTMKLNENKSFVLTNVRLEEGFIYNDYGRVKATQTGLYTIEVTAGVITAITKTGDKEDTTAHMDMQGKLLLPGLRDMHIHIDKTFLGEAWNAEPMERRTVKDMIALERKIMPELLKRSTEKAAMAIDLMNSKGTYFARCQTNIEPTSGLRSLENMLVAIEQKRDNIQTEIVAFPQHGILYSDAEGLLREAAQMGVDYIGGLDPTTVDGNMKKSLDSMLRIATDYNIGIDIHLHEGHQTGIPAINYMLDRIAEQKSLQGRSYISHGFALGQLEEKQLTPILERMAAYGVGLISTVPIGRTTMPIPACYKHGVSVMTGTDSIIDHWQPFGTCDMLEKAKLSAELYGWTDEFRLSRALQIATKDQVTPLADNGALQWPKVGDEASFIAVEASCSAEAVARNTPRSYAFNKGTVILS